MNKDDLHVTADYIASSHQVGDWKAVANYINHKIDMAYQRGAMAGRTKAYVPSVFTPASEYPTAEGRALGDWTHTDLAADVREVQQRLMDHTHEVESGRAYDHAGITHNINRLCERVVAIERQLAVGDRERLPEADEDDDPFGTGKGWRVVRPGPAAETIGVGRTPDEAEQDAWKRGLLPAGKRGTVAPVMSEADYERALVDANQASYDRLYTAQWDAQGERVE